MLTYGGSILAGGGCSSSSPIPPSMYLAFTPAIADAPCFTVFHIISGIWYRVLGTGMLARTWCVFVCVFRMSTGISAFVCGYACINHTTWSYKCLHASDSCSSTMRMHVCVVYRFVCVSSSLSLSQAKVATLKELRERASTEAGARTITVADI